jgi:DNA-binding beta-propeller fold protein YncE
MRRLLENHRCASTALFALVALSALLLPAAAPAASKRAPKQASPAQSRGVLTQLKGPRGCIAAVSKPVPGCGKARALVGPGPFMGSRAIALSPNGKNVYVASAGSDAIAIFFRNPKNGTLSQAKGAAGCIAAKAAEGCAVAVGLDAPNSVAVSADGRNVYATARDSNSVLTFLRNPKSGALTQLPPGSGCLAGLAIPGCSLGRALVGPNVVAVSPDGQNVYVGSFFGNAVAEFARDGATGALTQLSGSAGCIAEGVANGCASGIALGAPEGLAITGDGTAVYVAAALSNAVSVLARDTTTGALSQATDGSGCTVDTPLAGCAAGVQLAGANAVATGPGGAFVTSLFANSVTSFARSSTTTGLTQLPGTAGCLVQLRAVGCSFGRALEAPEGLAVSPDGANVYAAAFATGSIAVLDRRRETGSAAQKPGSKGCVAARAIYGCTRGRALAGVSSIALSPDGHFLYSTSNESNAVDVFRRATPKRSR